MYSQPTRMSPTSRAPQILRALLREGVEVRLRLTGFSMKPFVPSESTLRFSARAEPRVGDIVLLHYPSQCLVAHRVVALDDETIRTKGDSCKRPDEPVARSQWIATATALEGPGGFEIPLRNGVSRWLGRLASRVYPKLVVAFRSVWPVEELPSCRS